MGRGTEETTTAPCIGATSIRLITSKVLKNGCNRGTAKAVQGTSLTSKSEWRIKTYFGAILKTQSTGKSTE